MAFGENSLSNGVRSGFLSPKSIRGAALSRDASQSQGVAGETPLGIITFNRCPVKWHCGQMFPTSAEVEKFALMW